VRGHSDWRGAWVLGFGVEGSRLKVDGSWFRVEDLEFRVWVLGFRAEG